MKVKLFDCEDELDLENDINNFLNNDIDVIDIKYCVGCISVGGEQIFCFSSMIIYH